MPKVNPALQRYLAKHLPRNFTRKDEARVKAEYYRKKRK
jgi:hypothetical protein